MSEKPKIKFKWLEKIKNVKHIEVIIIAIFVIVLFLIYGSTFKGSSSSKSTRIQENSELTITKYVDDLEDDLAHTLSQIKGVSDVSVLITLNLNQAVIEENVIKADSFPEIKGIVVVAKGVDNTSVKMNVLRAIEAVLDISNGCVEILSSN